MSWRFTYRVAQTTVGRNIKKLLFTAGQSRPNNIWNLKCIHTLCCLCAKMKFLEHLTRPYIDSLIFSTPQFHQKHIVEVNNQCDMELSQLPLRLLFCLFLSERWGLIKQPLREFATYCNILMQPSHSTFGISGTLFLKVLVAAYSGFMNIDISHSKS